MEFTVDNRRHPFCAIPLFQNPELLRRLKTKVTTEPTQMLLRPTGVPPHVEQLNMITTLLDLCQTTFEKVNNQSETVRLSVFDALENRALENGQITRAALLEVIDEFRTQMSDQIETLRNEGIEGRRGNLQAQNTAALPAANATGTLFSYRGRFWDVPDDFLFPAGLKRDTGWNLWLLGMPAFATRGENGEIQQRTIKAFRNFVPSRLPKKVADIYKLHWRPVYKMMEQGLSGPIPVSPSIDEVNNLFEQGTNFMETRVSYIFGNPRFHYNEWTLATWSHHIGRNQIMKHGTENDKQNLPEQHRNNRPHNPGRKRRIAPQGPRRRSAVVRRLRHAEGQHAGNVQSVDDE